MAERQTGLRFDIYERVHLADDAVGVRQLDEVELVPHIQVYTEGDEALLKGNLFLTGSYAGEAGEELRTLEHLIPVEIILPLNRIHDVNQVYVDIDNFDVDVLNPRSMNVTGVLTLHGIEMLTVPEESWQGEEETVFVSRAADLLEAERQQEARVLEPAPEAQQPAQLEQPVLLQAVEAAEETRASEPQPAAQVQQEQEDVVEFYLQADEENEKEPAEANSMLKQGEAAEEPAAEALEAEAAEEAKEEPAAPVQEEKKEMKIAFGSKSSSEPSGLLKSLIHSGDTRQAVRSAAAVEEQAAPPVTDALEWKRLFARSERSEQTFSKVRVCILQKEETLDAVAARYSKNPREILLYNRVTEQELTEGKVLFIP